MNTSHITRHARSVSFLLALLICFSCFAIPSSADEISSVRCISVNNNLQFDVNTQIIQSWDSHANVEFTFYNSGNTRIDNWFFTFSTPYTIDNIWNASIAESDDNGTYTITNAVWNQDIDISSSVTVGMTLADPSGGQIEVLPSLFLLNTQEVIVDSNNYSVQYTEYSSYDDRFTGALTITAYEDISDWNLIASPNRQITEVSSAVLSTSDDGSICISNDGNNQNIGNNSSWYVGMQGIMSEEEFTLGQITMTETVLAYSLTEDKDGNGIPDYQDFISSNYEITPTPTTGPIDTVTPTVEITETPTPTEEVSPTVTEIPDPTITDTPVPTVTETPTPTESEITVTPTDTLTPTPTEAEATPTTIEPTPTEIDTTTDSDGDGLIDYIEDYLGTDKNDPDSDDDGLTDLTELIYDYDPLDPDSDDNGISDPEEDLDSDGLTNLYEQTIGTKLDLEDSDGDRLTDSDELNIYGTDPTLYDTDGDGVNDGDEIKLGKDPTDPTDISNRISQTLTVDLSDTTPGGLSGIDITCSLSGDIDKRINVENVYNIDMYATGVRGRIGVPFDIECSEEFSSATVVIRYDEEELGETGEEDIGILWIDSNTGSIVLQTSSIDTINNTITLELDHFSTYMMVDLKEWSSALGRGVTSTTNTQNCDFIFIINSSSDEGIRRNELETINGFIGHMRPGDRIGLIINDGSYAEDTCIELNNTLEHMTDLIEEAEDFLSESRMRDDYCFDFYCVNNMLSSSSTPSNTKVFVLTDRTSDWLGLQDNDGNWIEYDSFDTTIVLMGTDRNAEGSAVAADFGFRYFPYPMCDELWVNIMGSGTGKATDTDYDGLTDWDEVNGIMGIDGNPYYSDPNKTDTDGDGLSDAAEIGTIYTFVKDSNGYYLVYSNGLLVYDESEEHFGSSRFETMIDMVRKRFDLAEGESLRLADIQSDPTKKDTDGDGVDDWFDRHPNTYDLKTYSLGLDDMESIKDFINTSDEYIHVINPEKPNDSDGNTNYAYGGNQGWFSNALYTYTGLVIAFPEFGCGLIATNDVTLYLDNGIERYSWEYYEFRAVDLLGQFPGQTIAGVRIPIITLLTIEMMLEDLGYENHTSPVYSVNSDDLLREIKNSLKDNKPVILMENDPDIPLLDPLLENVFDYERVPGIDMYDISVDGNTINVEAKKTLHYHFVTITGVLVDDAIGKVYLKVQSWGNCYYVDYDEYVTYNEGAGRDGMLLFID